MPNDWRRMPKDGHSRHENQQTQPLKVDRLFNNPDMLVEGWYPLCSSRKLKRGEAKSYAILRQRIVVWRGEDDKVRALDAFCPHMGADLGNGKVMGNEIRCYFHHWQFSDAGDCTTAPCTRKTSHNAHLNAYPVEDYLGTIWIYAGKTIATPLIKPPGLENSELSAITLARPKLFAHHHVMMAGGIDLQHFATVHNLDIDFNSHHIEHGNNVHDWRLSGRIRPRGWRGRLGRLLIGENIGYTMRVAGGSVVSITYGIEQKLLGRFLRLPSLHILWGCMPLTSGVSRVKVFSVVKKSRGLFAPLKTAALHALTLVLVTILRDDDVKAFPNMRFSVAYPLPEDKTVLELIHAINRMPESIWTQKIRPIKPSIQETRFEESPLNIGSPTIN